MIRKLEAPHTLSRDMLSSPEPGPQKTRVYKPKEEKVVKNQELSDVRERLRAKRRASVQMSSCFRMAKHMRSAIKLPEINS